MRAAGAVASLVFCIALPLHAQRMDGARYAVRRPVGLPQVTLPATPDSSAVGFVRFLLATVGTGGGAIGGAYLGSLKRSQCNDDFCISGSVVLGVLAGGLIGAAVGAAVPPVPTCRWASRFGRALAGAAAGAAIGILLAIPGAALGSPSLVVAPLVLGPASGATLALHGCKSH